MSLFGGLFTIISLFANLAKVMAGVVTFGQFVASLNMPAWRWVFLLVGLALWIGSIVMWLIPEKEKPKPAGRGVLANSETSFPGDPPTKKKG